MSDGRKARVLDLAQVAGVYGQQMLLQHELVRVLEQSKKIVVLSGAGISVAAGGRVYRTQRRRESADAVRSPRFSLEGWAVQPKRR